MKPVYTLLLIALTMLFYSCYENDVFIEETSVEVQDEFQITPQELANESSIVVSNMLADMMKAMSLSAEVNIGSEDRIAQVRNSCPSTFLISDGVYPDTFFVDFDNCDPSAVFDQRYNGAVQFILYGELDDPNTCPLFSIKNSPTNPRFFINLDDQNNDLVRGCYIDITNDIDFCLSSTDGGNLKYTYDLDGEVIVERDNVRERGQNDPYDPITTYPDGMSGCVTLKSNNKDDITKPETFIDNTYCVSAKPTIIECTAQDGSIERLCIATNPEGISYNIRCGCPQSGKLYINMPANGECGNIIGSNDFWDYGFVQNPGVGSCENSALNPDNIVTRIPCGQSF